MKVDNVTKWYGQKLRERESEKTTTTPIDMAVCYVLCMCVFSKNNKFPKQELEKPHMLSPGKRADPRKFFSYP